MAGMFVCDGCGIESRDPGADSPSWFHDRVNDHDLCGKCRANWEEDGPMGKDERYIRRSQP